ncbi:MAG: peptidoglycan -binding protein [Paracoccus sp. (in: a-proteobacteria)]
MALSRGRGGGNRFSATIWPGFVDAMTALLMVLMFVLTIFMVVQSVLRDQVDQQESQLGQLTEQIAGLTSTLSLTQQERDAAEAARQAEADAADALRGDLKSTEADLAAATLSLEESRKKAEDTLTLLAVAEAAQRDLGAKLAAEKARSLSEAERQAALLALAQDKLSGAEKVSVEAQRRVALLNEQVARLNEQLGAIQTALDASESGKAAAELRLDDLGSQLNAALLQASEEQRQRLALEEAERIRLEQEAADLARYRSEFFGRLNEILQGREGVQVVGDRFVFQSEVLFAQGEATLSEAGRASIARVTDLLEEVSTTIPPEIDWVIRVDGHTDATPLSGNGRYHDNWELSQARALAVVRFMVDELGFPADRLAPTGFADTRPIASEDTPEGRARNRRIELKLTER